MALGDKNNGGYQGPNFPTYYPRMKIANYDNNTTLTHQFWNGSLKLIISFKVGDTASGRPQYDDQASINLSPVKARILYNELKDWLKDPMATTMPGTFSGLGSVQSFICVGNREDSTAELPKRYVTIGKIDGNGNIVSACDYDFQSQANFGIVWDDFKAGECHKNYQEGLDMDMFMELLEDFARSANGAYAYSVLDMGRYTIDRSLDTLLDHFGIERKGKSQSPSNGYFNRMDSKQQSGRTSGEFDTSDIEDSLS